MPMTMGELPPNYNLRIEDQEAEDVDFRDLEIPLTDDLVENDDGSVDVDLSEKVDRGSESFDENLTEVLDESVLDRLSVEYIELVEQDISARELRDKQYEEGIKRTGMGKEAPGGASFDGASRAVHPMLTKGCVDFASRTIKELFPATGPCKTQIIGEQTEEKLDQAERKKKYMNWQATTQIEEYRSELEKLLSQVPLGGAQYKRWWWDPELKRNRTEAVFIDNVFIPYGHSDFYTSPRITHRQRIMRSEYDTRVRTGLYRDLELVDDAFVMQDESRSQAATDKVDGAEPDNIALNKDGLRLVYQIECQLKLEEDPLNPDRTAPYILHIDVSSRKMLGLYRNWKEDDDRFRKKHWMSEWSFIPWRDGPAVGLAHIIGAMSGAATGALRAILDAAHIQNFPGGLKLKGGRTSGESVQVNATELKEIDAPAGMTDPDIRKLVMPFPFNGPSVVLFQVLEWLTQQAEQVVATASEKIAEAGNDMPVGTAMALIEHGSANFSAIHARLHASMKRDLEIQHRLNGEHMDDEETIEDLGELVVRRDDFVGPMNIVPVSDPNIFSETQRYAQIQAVMQLKADPMFTPYFKSDQLLYRALKLLQIPDIDGIANLPKDAKRLDAIEEHFVCSSSDDNRPLKVYEDQDDLTHLQLHVQYATSPMFGAHPLIAAGVMPKLLQHCKEHLLYFYRKHTKGALEAMKAAVKMRGLEMSDNELQRMAAGFAERMMAELLAPEVMPGLQKMQEIVSQIMQSQAPKPDPSVALVEQTKKDLKHLELQQKSAEAEKDRQQQAGLAQVTAVVEKSQQESQEKLAQLASSVQLIRDQQNNGAKQLALEFTAAKDTQRAVLLEVLTAALEPIKQQVKDQGENSAPRIMLPGNLDLATSLIQPLVGGIKQSMVEALQTMTSEELRGVITTLQAQQQNMEQVLMSQRDVNAAAIGQLYQAVTELRARVDEPVEAEIYVDPATGAKRARRVRAQPPQLSQGATQ